MSRHSAHRAHRRAASSTSTPPSPACTTRDLPASPWHDLGRGVPAPWRVVRLRRSTCTRTGDADGDFERVEAFIAQLRIVRLVANIGDARSLVAHPASMTHSHMTESQLADAGITSTTVRLSIGLEDADDIVADLGRALTADHVRLA